MKKTAQKKKNYVQTTKFSKDESVETVDEQLINLEKEISDLNDKLKKELRDK